MNDSIHWTADLAAPIAITWADDATWTLHVKSLAGPVRGVGPLPPWWPWTSPLAPGAARGQCASGGTDRTSYLLSAEGITMPTLFDRMADYVIDAIATQAGVATRYVGTTVLSAMRLQQFDVQGPRETLGGHIVRILRDAACNYRIGSDGVLEIFQMSLDQSLGNIQVHETERDIKRAGKYTQIWCQKQSMQQSSFVFTADSEGVKGGDIGPLGLAGSSISAQDASTSGSVWYAAFYSESGGNGNLVALKILSPEYYGQPIEWPPTNPGSLGPVRGLRREESSRWHHGGGKAPGAGLPALGVRLPRQFHQQVPLERHVPCGSGESSWASPLWPTLDLVQSNNLHEQMLWEANKNSDVVRRSVRFDPHAQPGGTLPADADAPLGPLRQHFLEPWQERADERQWLRGALVGGPMPVYPHLFSLMEDRKPSATVGSVSTSASGSVSLGGITPGEDGAGSVPSGMSGAAPSGAAVVVLYPGGDTQRAQGLGLAGWVMPS